jgi:hypothetical protein
MSVPVMKTLRATGLRFTPFLAAGAAVIAVIIGFLVSASTPARSQAPAASVSGFTFALIGDLGYFPQEEPWVDNVFADLNRNTSLAFVVHVGDLSSPRYSCTNEFWARRLAQFRASAHPLVYTPGDNEWTDCHEPAVKGGDPMERLARLRTVFFDADHTLGQRTFALVRQSQNGDAAFAKYRENVRWDLGGVTFATLHVTGSNNGLGRTPEGDAEHAERTQANLAWLRRAFGHAKINNSRAIMILQQANLFPEFPPFPGTPQSPSGYTDLRLHLQKEAAAFGKPVVLVHGDSHFFRIDKPLSPRPVRGTAVIPALENFTRVETFGSPYHHWVHVTVDATDSNVFTFRPRLVSANVTRQQ